MESTLGKNVKKLLMDNVTAKRLIKHINMLSNDKPKISIKNPKIIIIEIK